MISALVLSTFLFTATEAEPLDILEEPASTICTPSGCPIGGHIEKKPSEEGSE